MDLAQYAATLDSQIRPHPTGERLFLFSVDPLSIERYPVTLRALEKAGDLVQYAEPDYLVHAFETFPNDPRFDELWGMHNTGQSGGVENADIDAPEAWDNRREASSVRVAVIDTGIRLTHEDLSGNLWANPNEIPGNSIDDDGNGYVDDIFGINAINGSGNPNDDNDHGTHVAGIIGAVGNNGVGVAGVAWDVQLMALKFLSSGGSGPVANAIECIDYAIARQADIMNNSWGGGGFSNALSEAIEGARQMGILFVAAAGNDGEDNDRFPTFPASYPHDNVVSVASTTRVESLSSFSNFGETRVDIAAPGSSIVSADNSGDSAYKTQSGTSMAAPHVSGIMALLREENPAENYLTLINRLYAGGDPVIDYRGGSRTGRRANLNGALLPGIVPDYPLITSPVGDQIVAEGQSIALSVSATGSGPFAYQWYRAGESILGAVGDTLHFENVSVDEDGEYQVVLTGPAGETTSSGRLEVGQVIPELGNAVDAPSFAWVSSGDALWVADNVVSQFGGSSAVNGDIGDGERSRLSAAVSGPGTITFNWKVSSESNWDFLNFLIGGEVQESISGEVDWSEKTFDVPAGFQTLEWTYSKDTSVSDGDDSGWVDQFQFAVNGVVPPFVLEEPRNIAVLVGGEAAFSVVAGGSEPFTYQWFRGSNALQNPSAGLDRLVISNVTFADAGEYSLEIENTAGSISSSSATLTVDDQVRSPFVTAPPKSQSVDAGDDVTFTVEAGGTSPFLYQWRKEGIDITGEGAANLTLSSVTIDDAGSYSVRVSNSAGFDISATAELNVFDASLAPSITKQPISRAAFSGEGVTLTVEASGEGDLRFQWRKDGAALTIPSGESDTLVLTSVGLGDDGVYTVIVSNDFGAVTSDPATLTVLAADPALGEGVENTELTWGSTGDSFWFVQDEVSFDGVDALQSGEVSNAEDSSLVTLVEGPGFLSFTWMVSSELSWDFLRFYLDDTLIDEISGFTDWEKMELLVPDGTHTLRWVYEKDPFFTFGADAGWIDAVVYVSSDVDAPFIYAHPANQSVIAGDAVTLMVASFGAGPLSYQWEKDGVPIAGATSDSLVIPSALFADAGVYQVTVSNAFGSEVSDSGVLDVFSSDPFGDALDLPGQVWSGEGDALWFAQTIVSRDDQDALQSGAIDHLESSEFALQITGPIDLGFWWKASTENFFDPVGLYLNGILQASLSGERDWHRQLLRLPPGDHTVGWSYEKDESVDQGEDTVWVDELEFVDVDGIINGALESGLFAWEVNGASWFAQSMTTKDGVDALQAGPISHNGESRLQTTVSGPGSLSYFWKVSSEFSSDRLEFTIDGILRSVISGEADWREGEFFLEAGEHTLRWEYEKSPNNDAGEDTGWLDQLTYLRNHPPVLEDFSVAGNEDGLIGFTEIHFLDAFSDANQEDMLVTVRIETLPENGLFSIGGAPVVAGATFAPIELNGLSFQPDENWNGETGFAWTGSDGAQDSANTAQATIVVHPVNDPPVVYSPNSLFTGSETTIAVVGISVSDIDAQSGILTYSLTVNSGHLTLDENVPGGLVSGNVSQNGSASVIVTAPLQPLNTTLLSPNGLLYASEPGFVGNDSLIIQVDDNSNSGLGGPAQGVGNVSITVTDSGHLEWLDDHFDANDLADPELESTLWGDRANADGDQLPNLIEFFMALDPTADDGEEGFEFEADEGILVFIYRKSKEATGVSGFIEWTDDFQNWTGQGVTEQVVRDELDATVIEARIPMGEKARFVRLRVTR